MISVHDASGQFARGELAWFRQGFYGCLTGRKDALFELSDAVLCADGPVVTLPELSLLAEHRRGHGGLYEGLNQGRIADDDCRDVLARQSLPRCDEGRIVLGIDVSNWLRPDAATSPDRLFCHTYGRGKGQAQIDSRMALLVCGRLGARTHVVDRPAGHHDRDQPLRHRGGSLFSRYQPVGSATNLAYSGRSSTPLPHGHAGRRSGY